MTQKKVSHVHAEFIKAWADGDEVQWRRDWGMNPTEWANVDKLGFPGWGWSTISFRVKPEPKPDVVLYGCVERADFNTGQPRAKVFCCFADEKQIGSDTCMFVFDGETGALKDCQILAKE